MWVTVNVLCGGCMTGRVAQAAWWPNKGLSRWEGDWVDGHVAAFVRTGKWTTVHVIHWKWAGEWVKKLTNDWNSVSLWVWWVGEWGSEQISGLAPVTSILFNCCFSTDMLILLYTGCPIKQMDTGQTRIYDRCYVPLKSLISYLLFPEEKDLQLRNSYMYYKAIPVETHRAVRGRGSHIF
jgi:hypothetical protein